jgi:hypothetical protein
MVEIVDKALGGVAVRPVGLRFLNRLPDSTMPA